MSNYNFTLNMIPNTGTPVVVNLSQGDIGRELTFKLVEGSDPNITIATDATAITIAGTKPSGLGFTETCTATSGNTITVSTTEAMTQESGVIPAEVRFVAGAKDLGTANIIFAIEESPHPAGTTDGTQDTMQNLEARLQAEIDDVDDRVTALEEAEDSGLTQEEKNLILTLFNKAAYAEDDAKTSYDALEALWRTVYRSITYNLTNCRSSSSVTSVENGKGYSTALSVLGGYSITTVSVTMGGTDVTSQYYHSGSISIPRVTGDVVITAVATKSVNSITATYTQSGTVYTDDDIDSLKSDLVVTATYNDSSTETVPSADYELSGTLASGTSTITVTYESKTTTFTVNNVVAPLYSIPDFAEQTITGSTRSQTVSKTNGIYTMTGTLNDVVYIYPDGTAHNSKSNTLWFATPGGKPIVHEIYDITWSNPNSITIDLACKFSQSNTTGNKATATYTMSANESGTDGRAEFTNDAYATANFSSYGIQAYHEGAYYNSNITVSFKMRLFCDGVRYL